MSSITQWGKTALSFGKYKGSKSYAEMFEGTSEDLASYRNYCQSHYQSGSPALKDLVDYFRARGMHHEASQSVIPGSTIRRVYQKHLMGVSTSDCAGTLRPERVKGRVGRGDRVGRGAGATIIGSGARSR